MCDDGHELGPDGVEEDDGPVVEERAEWSPRPSRRLVLGGLAAAVGAPVALSGGSARGAGPSAVTGQTSQVAAMHLHASFSEQQGSWEGQAWRMQQEGVDLMFMTDHSHGQLATHMASDLTGLDLVPVSTGSSSSPGPVARPGGGLSLAVASTTSQPATAGILTDPTTKRNLLGMRTSVMGQVLRHTFGAVSVDPGGLYEVRVGLSHHPAAAGRPAGIHGLCFRFGPGLTPGTQLEDRGLTGVLTAPLPAAGTTVALDLEAAVASAWPDLIPQDQGTQYLSFTATSPGRGVSVSVDVTAVVLDRAARTPADVAAVQQTMATRYSARYGVSIVPAAELGKTSHVNAFAPHQFFAADEELSYRDPATYVQRNVAAIHAQGGLVSWNHPFGATQGKVTTGQAAVTRRRNVYAALAKQDVWGVDILEVGYAVRGSMGIDDHLALWDTFSRQARFLTGNGVSDSHDSAHDRLGFANEFVTGVWAPTTGLGDVLPALSAGRAWTRHARAWAGGRLDLVVDDTYLMGQVAVVGSGVHRLAVAADALPPGSVVEVVAGPVDLQGVDPGTVVLQRLPASAFGAAGVAGCTVDVSSSVFVRVTVRSSAGTVIGLSNPVWLLLSPPPNGVPAPRRP